MKRIAFIICALLLAVGVEAQQKKANDQKDEDIYKFNVKKELPSTSVKNQNRSSTCWSFSTIAFLESELLRMGKPEYDLSEMFIVRKNFEIKGDKYVRMHGETAFSPGALAGNVISIIKNYGIVPEEVYNGMNYGDTMHIHTELDAVTTAYIKAATTNRSRRLTTAWKDGFSGILDAYLGSVPEKFTHKGTEYTPKSFANSLGFNMDDYVDITSFTHHPFYTQVALEIPDNYFWNKSYNIPMDEMIKIIDNSLELGYTVAWGADVSEKGFQYRKGFAVVPEKDEDLDQTGSDRARWEAASGNKNDKKKEEPKPTPVKEKVITQEMRQVAFDNYETQDDHGMLIMGTATDQNGNRYYKVKNSWGTTNSRYDGYFFVSIPYVQYKTISIMVNKKAIPADIAKKMGL
ncbi:MAG: C1 family peptidase [Prevotellaceae bacterium]|jgi:bleomycin hydrolase|nr:C1 family peptidase [Prevotellaceae bacterium]